MIKEKSCCWLSWPQCTVYAFRMPFFVKVGVPRAPFVCLCFFPRVVIHCSDHSTFSHPFLLGFNVWFDLKVSMALQLQK